MSENNNSVGCFLAIGITSIVILGFVLWGNIMDDIQGKKTTSPIFSFILLILGVGGIIGYTMARKRN
jgi:hypothetical protein